MLITKVVLPLLCSRILKKSEGLLFLIFDIENDLENKNCATFDQKEPNVYFVNH